MGLFDGGIDWGQIASGMATPDPNALSPFQSRWPTPGGVLPTPSDPMASPISPEALAQSAASRGIPPPQQDLVPPAAQPIRMPGQEAMDNWRAGVDATNAAEMGGPGVTPTPGAGKPLDVTTPVQQAASQSTDVSAQSKTADKNKTPSLADVLKGTKMPEGPTLQKLGTPAAPKPTNQIKSGDLIAMLQALNTGANMQSGYQLPSTLGQALLGRK